MAYTLHRMTLYFIKLAVLGYVLLFPPPHSTRESLAMFGQFLNVDCFLYMENFSTTNHIAVNTICRATLEILC